MRKELVVSILSLILTVIAVGVSLYPVYGNVSLMQAVQKWTTHNANVISWAGAGQYIGQVRTVEGTIVYTHVSSKGTVFLDFYPYQGYLYAVIFSNDAGNFKCSPTNFYYTHEVRITGFIQSYEGIPLIILSSPLQIEVAYMGFGCL